MAATIVSAITAAALFAAIPNRTPEQLQERSDVIVVGTVHEIHAQRTTDELWDNQKGTVLFHVEKVEKAKEGQKIEAGDQLRIGFWTMRWVGPREDAPTYGAGHYLPKPDPTAKVRAYIGIKDDGTYEAILPNGLVPLNAEKPAK